MPSLSSPSSTSTPAQFSSKRKSSVLESNSDGSKSKRKLELSPAQQTALDTILTGKNVFLTGAAGSGKSYLLNKSIEVLNEKYSTRRVAVTATTGVASTHIGGTTTHAWSGITNSQLTVAGLVVSIKLDKAKLAHWTTTRVLVIDEISMLDGAFLDKLNQVAKRVRKNEKAFGGIQLVFCGDFYQLPPVTTNNKQRVYAFESEAWKECGLVPLSLPTSFRQRDDTVFQTILNEARKGALSDGSVLALYNVQRRAATKKTLQPLQVFARRASVDAANKRRLTNLNKPVHIFSAKDKLVKHGAIKNVKMALNAALTIPEMVEMAQGAQVMLVKNLDTSKGLVNGAVGVVESLGTYTKLSDENTDEEDGCMTVSLLTSSSGRKVLYKPAEEQQPSNSKIGVLVQFDNGIRGVVAPLKVEMEDDVGDTLATRYQIPLVLAWATTIHKSQGQTLPSVTVHFNDIFEHGMAYVALSRVRCLDDLNIKGFEKSRLIVDKKVKKFDKA